MNGNVLQPPKVPTDTVIPLHTLDDASFYKRMVTSLTFQFNDVLDPVRLGAALERLLSMEGWTKLGARLRTNAQGGYEYHIPERFSPDRPALAYSSAEIQTSIHDHPVGSKLPATQQDPVLIQVDSAIPGRRSLLFRPDAPTKLEHYLARDEPQLSVHVVTFTDATLITLSFLHTLTDGLGIEGLLRGWTAVLDGREQEVPKFVGFDQDPLTPLMGKTPGDRNVLYDRYHNNPWVPTSVQLPDTTHTWLRIPGNVIARLKDTAMVELKKRYDPSENAFVSQGDVFQAWLAQALIRTQHVPASANVVVVSALNYRAVLSDVFPPGSAYVSNCIGGVHSYLTAGDLLDGSLAEIALRFRRELDRQRTRENVESTLTLMSEKKRLDLNMLPITMSDCGKINFCDFDFSSAIRTQGEGRPDRHGQPTHLWGGVEFSPSPFPNMCVNWGVDAQGDWSTVLYVPTASLDALEEEVKALKTASKDVAGLNRTTK